MKVFRTLVLVFVLTTSSYAATPVNFFGPLRSAITDEIAVLNSSTNQNDTPRDIRQRRAQIRTLVQANRLLNRPGRGTLGGDLQILTTVANTLGRTFPNNDDFTLLLDEIAVNYADVITQAAATIRENLSELPSSPFTDAAQQTLEFIDINLANLADATTPLAAARILGRTATLLSRGQTLARQAGTSSPAREEFTARISGAAFRANDGITPTAFYSPAAAAIAITGTQRLGSGDMQTITLTLANVRSGTTVHPVGDVVFGNTAVYTTATTTNSVTYTSVSGTARVSLDLIANTVSGNFSFVANRDALEADADRTIVVTGGSFFVRLQ